MSKTDPAFVGDKPGSSTPPITPPARDPLDHDGDSRTGGAAPTPPVQHLAVIRDDPERGLTHGQVIAVSDQDAKLLLANDSVRVATDIEVELAQPFVRPWAA